VIAVVITVVTVGALVHSLFLTRRTIRIQGERLLVQSGVRSAMLAVLSELRELSTEQAGSGAQNDILSIGPAGLSYRGMRGTGFTCQSSGTTQLRIQQSSFSGWRSPQAGRDSLLVLLDTAAGAEPVWIALGLTAVATGAPCPGNIPAVTLTTTPFAALGGRPSGIPVRSFEPMELRAYQSDAKFWLGARSLGAGEAIQPLFGPLTDATGFQLTYRNRNGMLTSDRTAIRSIGVRVRGTSELSSEVEEQLTAEVALRNAAP
jgi:hypothetical protein